MEEYKRNPNTSCFLCETKIYRRPKELEKSNGRAFCTMKCYGIFCRKENPCPICGTPVLGGLHKKTCSRACANKYRAGIKYKIGRPRDKAQEIRALKIKLVEQRGNVCGRCNYQRYDILEVHHKNRDRSDNSLGNLEIICPNCHAIEHFLEKEARRRA